MSIHEASCSCGALTATVTGEPIRVSVCHCLACQRRTGSAFGVQARFDPSQVVTRGESREWTRHSDDEPEHYARFHFCPICGATVFYDFGEDLELVVIPVGAFADPEFPPPSRTVYEVRQHPWVEITSELTERND